MFYEKIRDIQLIGSEVREYFDGLKNIGVAVYSTMDIEYSMYAYYDFNELVVVQGCISPSPSFFASSFLNLQTKIFIFVFNNY